MLRSIWCFIFFYAMLGSILSCYGWDIAIIWFCWHMSKTRPVRPRTYTYVLDHNQDNLLGLYTHLTWRTRRGPTFVCLIQQGIMSKVTASARYCFYWQSYSFCKNVCPYGTSLFRTNYYENTFYTSGMYRPNGSSSQVTMRKRTSMPNKT